MQEQHLQSLKSSRNQFDPARCSVKYVSLSTVQLFHHSLLLYRVASEILDDCLRDASKELEDINNEIVNQVYSREFAIVPSPDSPKHLSPSSQGIAMPSTSGQTMQSYSPRSKHPVGRSQEQRLPATHQNVVKLPSRENSQDDAVPRSAQSPSPDPVSGNYSYEDDFAESSPRGKTTDDVSNRSDYSQDSWKTDE
jgi:hypothetical protein